MTARMISSLKGRETGRRECRPIHKGGFLFGTVERHRRNGRKIPAQQSGENPLYAALCEVPGRLYEAAPDEGAGTEV